MIELNGYVAANSRKSRLAISSIFFMITFFSTAQLSLAQEKAVPKLSRVAEQLYQKGFKACNSELDTAVKWIHDDDARYGLHTLWNEKNPNYRMALATTSESYSDGSRITSFFATRDAAGNCSVAGDTTMYVDVSCIKVRETTFKEWKFSGDMGSTSTYNLSDEVTTDLYLTPNKSGCLIVKRFIFYY